MHAWLLLLLSVTASAADWPQFLGPDRDASSPETGLVAGWRTGPRELWRVPLGPGFASVAVAGGAVYAMTSREGEEQLLALDASTGRELWRAPVGPFWNDTQGFDGPRATPTVSVDRVIAVSGTGVVVAVDRARGRVLWSVDAPDKLGAAAPTWGFAGSPLVAEGRVHLSLGGKAGLVALSVVDGTVLWQHPGFPAAGYASPIRATLAGKDQILFFTGAQIVGTHPAEGTVIWQHPWPTSLAVNAASPVVVGSNRVFVASGYGVGGATLLVGDDGTASPLWQTKKMKNKMSTSVLHEGHLYGFNEERLSCLDVTTGEQRWSQDGLGRGALVLAEGHLFVLTEDCRVAVVEATPAGYRPVGEARKVLKDSNECWASPALADGVLYVRDNQELVALELRAFGPSVPR